MSYGYSIAVSAACAALGDATRMAVLDALRGGSLTVGEIAARLPVSRPAVSQQLKVLRAASLVTERQAGTRHYFSLNPAALLELRAYVDAMWRDALGSYAAHVSAREQPDAR
jgi:DNA-binding transcriptional ArsR family regulator